MKSGFSCNTVDLRPCSICFCLDDILAQWNIDEDVAIGNNYNLFLIIIVGKRFI